MNNPSLSRQERKAFRLFRRVITSLDGATDIRKRDVTPDTELDSFSFDSLCIMEICTELERRCGVRIDAHEIESMRTCTDAAKYLCRLKDARDRALTAIG